MHDITVRRMQFEFPDGIDPIIVEEHADASGGPAGRRARLRAQSWRAQRGLVPSVLATYTPWYTPEGIAFTDQMRAYAERFHAAAVGVSR
jgi:hypothetical protein